MPIIQRAGGKYRMLPRLLPILDAIPHELYCEPFCGGGAVLLAKRPAIREVLNDIDGEIINLFKQATKDPRGLYRHFKYIPESRAYFYELLNMQNVESLSEQERAARYAYLNLYCFGGENRTYGLTRVRSRLRSNYYKRLLAFAKRMQPVALECVDWRRCIEIYDTPKTLFFIDPPYMGNEAKSYKAWKIEDVQQLKETLDNLRGRWVVTLNDAPEIRAVFDGCNFEEVETRSELCKMAKAQTFKEIIITKKRKGNNE